MITTGSKWFFGLGLVSLVLAVAYGWTTGGSGVGPLTMGYKGGVGDHLGYGLLVAAGFISLFLGSVSLAVRDADAEAVAQVAGSETVPAAIPAPLSYWPAVTAFGVALVIVGLVASPVLFVFGLVALGIVLVEWAVQTWADRATGDPATNRQIRNHLMNPIEFPAAGLLAIGVVVVAFSRIFLTLSADAAVWVGIGIATVIVVAGFFFASRPRLSRNVIVAVLLVAAVAVIGVGMAGAVRGEREFHEPGAEATTEEGG
jgi:multidrug transporter EmrE-like cation transporter